MDSQLEIQQHSRYLMIVVRGTRTRESIADLAKEVVRVSAERGATRVLVNITGMVGSLSILDDYEVVGHEMVSLPVPPTHRTYPKTAIVDLPEHRERSDFFETAARNRGFNLRIFTAVDSAVEWLCE